jgi:hypothetical protein
MQLWKKLFELTVTKVLYIGKGALVSMAQNSLLIESSLSGIVAKAGGGQTNATQLTNEVNEVGTVATAGDSVKLPAAVAGLTVYVANKGANPMQVFGLATDTVDDVAAATGVSQMVNSIVLYTCTITGKWRSEGLATGYSGSYQTLAYKDTITAHAGGTQAGAIGDPNAQLPGMLNRVSTVGTAADSVVLPAGKPGMTILVANDGANSLNVFPFTGESINAGAANAAFAVAAAKSATFTCILTGKWHAILSA